MSNLEYWKGRARDRLVEDRSPKGKAEQAEAPSVLGTFEHRCPAVTGHRGGVFVCQSAGHGVSQNSYCKDCTCPAALATQPTASNAGEREDFEAWADRTQPAYWRTTAWAREAWPMWRDMRAALASKPVAPPAREAQKPAFVYNGEGYRDLESMLEGYNHGTEFFTAPPPEPVAARGAGERWLNVESAMSDPLFQQARAIMGTENWFQDNALRNVINYVLSATPPAQAVQDSAVLAYLDDLSDDAAAHIYPSDLEKCSNSECVVEVCSVRAGNGLERTVPLFSRGQVVEALNAARTRGNGVEPS